MTLLERLAQAQPKQRPAILADSLQDVDRLAQQSIDHPSEYMALLIALESSPGLKTAVPKWRKAVDGRAKELQRIAHSYTPPSPLAEFVAALDSKLDDLEAPEGYRCDRSGVHQGETEVTATPIVVIGHHSDIETRAVSVELAWLDTVAGRWERVTVPARTIADTRAILALADLGLDVTSDNASAVVGWLRRFGTWNKATIPRTRLSRRCGWHGAAFQRGRYTHSPTASAPITLDADGGLGRIADGIATRGNLGAWLDMIETHVAHRPSVLLALYASAVAPLLHILEAPGFVIDWSGPPGRGKSTALDVAASLWGNPDVLCLDWDTSSTVGPQEIASFLHHIPLLMDDTKRAESRPHVISDMIYAIPAGLDRIRGRKGGGIRDVKTWHTVLLSTGERPITSFDGNAGARRRSLCITGPPLGSDSADNANAARDIAHATRSHYGAAGGVYASHLCSTPRNALRERYGALTREYAQSGRGSTERSLGSALAALEVAAEVLGRAIEGSGCEWPVSIGQRCAAIELGRQAAAASGEDSDQPVEAIRSLWRWCASNRKRMYVHGPPQQEHTQGWAGVWDASEYGWKQWGMVPEVVEKLLGGWGRDYAYCVREWERRHMLVGRNGRGRLTQTWVGGVRTSVLMFEPGEVSGLLEG